MRYFEIDKHGTNKQELLDFIDGLIELENAREVKSKTQPVELFYEWKRIIEEE